VCEREREKEIVYKYERCSLSRTEEVRNVYRSLVGKPEGQTPLGRPRHRWEDNIRMDLREIGWEGVDWMHVA
jgi:hypothetical protein